MAKIIKHTIGIISTLILVLLAVYVALAVLFPTQFKHIYKNAAYVVISDSMEPTIEVMSMIIIKPVEANELKINDIITFKQDFNEDGIKEVITHRVAQITPTDDSITLRTKPDESDLWDSWIVEENDIIGKVHLIIPKVGHLTMFMNQYAKPILVFLNILIWSMMIRIVVRWNKD